MPCTLVAAFALVFLTTTSAPVHAETLDGKIVRTSFSLHDIHFNEITSFTRDSVVGPGIELVDFGFDIGLDYPLVLNKIDIDFSDTNILITSRSTGGFGPTVSIDFQDVYGTIPRFTDVTINPATNWTGFDSSHFHFHPNSINLRLDDTEGFEGEQISLDITAIIPEPATWLLATVLAAFFAVRRKRTHPMPCTLVAVLALAFLTTTTAPVHAEILDGHIVRTEYTEAQPHGESISIIRDTVVGPGTEITDGVRGFQFDFSDTNILITNTIDHVLTSWAETGRFIFEDAYGTIPRFTGVTVNPATTWPGSIPNYIHFSPNSIVFGLEQGLHVTEGAQLSLDITAIIPEPATAGLLLVGVVFIVAKRGLVRNRKELS
jgi:hypothetical protein